VTRVSFSRSLTPAIKENVTATEVAAESGAGRRLMLTKYPSKVGHHCTSRPLHVHKVLVLSKRRCDVVHTPGAWPSRSTTHFQTFLTWFLCSALEPCCFSACLTYHPWRHIRGYGTVLRVPKKKKRLCFFWSISLCDNWIRVSTLTCICEQDQHLRATVRAQYLSSNNDRCRSPLSYSPAC
jgi:hypothetical protein